MSGVSDWLGHDLPTCQRGRRSVARASPVRFATLATATPASAINATPNRSIAFHGTSLHRLNPTHTDHHNGSPPPTIGENDQTLDRVGIAGPGASVVYLAMDVVITRRTHHARRFPLRRTKNSACRPRDAPPGQSLTLKFRCCTVAVPAIDPAAWSLAVFGEVEREMRWTWDEFRLIPRRKSIRTSTASRAGASSTPSGKGRACAFHRAVRPQAGCHTSSPTPRTLHDQHALEDMLDDDVILAWKYSRGIWRPSTLPVRTLVPSVIFGRAPNGC